MDFKTALVTGGAGFIGSHLVDQLVDRHWRVKVIDNLSSGRATNLKDRGELLKFIRADMKKLKHTLSVVGDVDLIFHFAANPEVRLSTVNPKVHFDENILTTFNLLEALRIRGEEKSLIFASSSSVYGEQSDSKITEGSPIRPVSVYGATKASCEMLIRAYSVLYGIKSVSLRFANIIGPRLRHGVIYDFVNKLRRDTTRLQILGDGKQTRSYLHVNDTVAATLTILDSIEKSAERYEVYNIGNEDWLSVNQVADLVLEVMDLGNIKRDYKQVLQGVGWPGDVKRITLDITKLRKLGFSPRMTGRNAALSTTKSILEELDQEL